MIQDTVVGRVDHIGIAVADLSEAISRYQQLYQIPGASVTTFEGYEVRCAEIQAGNIKFELVEAASEISPVRIFLDRHGEGVHHICFVVEDLVDAIREMEERGVEMIDQVPRVGANGQLVACANPRDTGGILIELAEQAF